MRNWFQRPFGLFALSAAVIVAASPRARAAVRQTFNSAAAALINGVRSRQSERTQAQQEHANEPSSKEQQNEPIEPLIENDAEGREQKKDTEPIHVLNDEWVKKQMEAAKEDIVH